MNIDWDWFCETDFSKYKGQYLALKNKEVVANSETVKGLLNDLQEKRIQVTTVLIHFEKENQVVSNNEAIYELACLLRCRNKITLKFPFIEPMTKKEIIDCAKFKELEAKCPQLSKLIKKV